MNIRQHHHISDAELLELHRADGNTEWIGILLQRYTLLLFGVCMKYLKNEEEAKDSVQQIFLKVLSEAGKYKIDYFKSWLYMVAKNHCLMRLRATQGRATKELNEKDFMAATDEGPSGHLQDEHTYVLLEEAIEELSSEQKQAVTLFYLHKKSYMQIVAQTGYSLLQVKSYIQNGKRNLRILIEKKQKQKGAAKK